jgi:hypothetical protein
MPSSTNENQLFDNPMVEAARQSMTSEQIEEYKQLGEQYYGTIDFETGQSTDPLHDAVAYIVEGLRSGLHPSYLEEEERKVMESTYGPHWMKSFGYPSIVESLTESSSAHQT